MSNIKILGVEVFEEFNHLETGIEKGKTLLKVEAWMPKAIEEIEKHCHLVFDLRPAREIIEIINRHRGG